MGKQWTQCQTLFFIAIYDDSEKDILEDFSKTEDYGKIVDLVNEQKKNK